MFAAARLTIAMVALTAALFPAAAVAAARAPSGRAFFELGLSALLAVPASVVAVLVNRRRPTGWLAPMLALTGFLPALALLSDIFKQGALRPYLVALDQGSWVLLYAPAALLVLFFPSGRLRGRDRLLGGAIVADALLFIAIGALYPAPYPAPDEHVPHVFGTLPQPFALAIVAITLPGILVTLVLTTASLVRRYRRASFDLRAQMLWLALAAMLLPLALLAAWAGYVTVNVGDPIVLAGVALAYAAVPAVIGISLLRPDLFDVNRVLASTATHAAATAVVLALFTAANVAAGVLLPGNSVVAAVAATSVCALLLAPLRARLQRRVDRWFYPARRAALAAIEELGRHAAIGDARPEQLEEVLQQALADPTLRVGVIAPNATSAVDVTGEPFEAGMAAVPVLREGQQIGVISAATPTSPELLKDIATAAAPMVEVVRLRLELHQALREVELSRVRMLRAGDEERQRLERDLHDGAQLRLVSLGMALRVAQRQLSKTDVDVHGLLDQAVAELGTAVSELRQLAEGIRPSCLDEGLAPALSMLVEGVPIPVDVRIAETPADSDLQTTAYYVASEAITNAVKHSCAQRITLDIDARGDDVHIRVTDDGIGGASQHDGSGLSRLADRVSAHGGTLNVSSPPQRGTTVEAILPCAS